MVAIFLFLFNNIAAKPLILLVEFFVDVLAMCAPSAPPECDTKSHPRVAFLFCHRHFMTFPDIHPTLPIST